jgi:hypothetical protein
MQYNTTRELLNIREYGRGVHMMVKHLKTIQDKEHRQRNAEAIIEVMAILSPQQKAIEDYKHKLWDHLFLIAGYDLDVECPYPIPTEEIKMRKPDPLPYPKNKIKWSHLGYKFENLFQKAIAETDEEKRQGYVATLILFMKTAYQNWHKENATEDMLRDELIQMSNGQLVYEPGTKFADVVNTADDIRFNPSQQSNYKPFGNGKRYFNNRNNGRNNAGNRPNGNGMGNKFSRFKKKK